MKYLKTLILAVALFVSLSAVPEQAQAHGEAGLTLSATSTNENGQVTFVDVDYTELAIVARDSAGRFTFDLFGDETRTRPVDYTDLWVRIVEDTGKGGGRTVFAGPIYPTEFGGVGFLFTFPESGKYTMHVRYNDADKGNYGETVAEAEFPLDVLRSKDENAFDFSSSEFWIGLVGGLFAALLILLPLLMRKKS